LQGPGCEATIWKRPAGWFVRIPDGGLGAVLFGSLT
jgi:hypothetical protein